MRDIKAKNNLRGTKKPRPCTTTSASILRRIYVDGPLGVSKLRTIYGDNKNNGHGPNHHGKASGKVIRTALQNLEEAGLVETEEGEGRKITEDGQALLDDKAGEV